jgi:hypothetical protein
MSLGLRPITRGCDKLRLLLFLQRLGTCVRAFFYAFYTARQGKTLLYEQEYPKTGLTGPQSKL